MAKKDKESATKLAKRLKQEAKKETKKKKLNTEVDRSDVKPPSPFSS
jgi:hypothetical protein